MKNWILMSGLVGLMACGSKSPTKDIVLLDAPAGGSADAQLAGCSVLTQMGCNTGERCTWVHSTESTPDTPALGANACAPDTGTVALGGACTYGPAGDTGYDNCMKGFICVHKLCKTICDPGGGAPLCEANAACVTYDSLFANSGATTIPAGACDPTCNPLDDNDFDGSGALHTKTGTACGTDATIGCYGHESTTAGNPTHFTCATPVSGTELLTHRSVIPANKQFLNACTPGYAIAFAHDATGSNNIDCYAFCKPGDSYMGNAGTQAPNGVQPHRCNNNDALGAFGSTATATTNGEHCMFSWFFEVDTAGMVQKSPSSDTVGICWDHTKYQYDANGDGTVDTVVEACGTLPLTQPAGNTNPDATTWGCVSTATAMLFNGKTHIKRPYVANLPELLNVSMSAE